MTAYAAETTFSTQIEYYGGEIIRSNTGSGKSTQRSLQEDITVAYSLPQDGELTVGKISVWHTEIEGGTEPYHFQYALFRKDFSDTGNEYTYVEGSSLETTEPTYTVLIPEEGWYVLQFTVTDALGDYVVYQSARFATSTDEIRLLVEEIVSSCTTEDMSDYEKALVLHDSLCDSAAYDDSLTIHEPAGVLLQKTGVCESFALAYQMLLSEAGVENIYVEGIGGNEPHAWNMIQLDGEWYHVDVTWDEDNTDRYFFCMNDALIERSHTVRTLVPEATGTKYNYAVNQSDGTFSSLDELLELFQQLPDDQEFYNFYYTGSDLISEDFYSWCQQNGDAINLRSYGSKDCTVHTLCVYGSLSVSETGAQPSPIVPENLSVTTTSQNSAILSWDGNEDAITYEVYASANDEGYVLLATVTEEEYIAGSLGNGVWRFKVRAIYEKEQSIFTKAVYLTIGQHIQLDFPTGLTLASAADDSVYMTWDAVENATGYRIYISMAQSSYALYAETNINSLFAKDLPANYVYSFKVSAVSNANKTIVESELSEESSILLTKPTPSAESLFTITSSGQITAYSGTERHLVVPDKINGITVKTINTSVFSNASFETIVLPDTITNIQNSAFSNCTSLKYIKLPEQLTSLGNGAFSGCTSLEAVLFNTKLSGMYGRCFEGCSALRDAALPSSLTIVNMSEMFYKCTSLKSVSLPPNATWLNPDDAFAYCSALEEIDLPESLTTIGNLMFVHCSSLKEIVVPSKVTSIGYSALEFCTSLEKITLPEGLQTIGDSAFCRCDSLESITIPTTVTSIGSYAFSFSAKLRQADLPNGLTSLGYSAFSGCSSLLEISIPARVTALGTSTFNACSSLRKISLHEGLLSIGDSCFRECTSLREITIPSTVQTIGAKAFEYDTTMNGSVKVIGLTKIYLNCPDVSFPSDMVTEYYDDAPLLFIVPENSNAYALCEQYGYLCAAPGDSIEMTAGYSTDKSNPTQLQSGTLSLNLETEEGIAFETVALISDGRVYSFPFDNNTVRLFSTIVNRKTEGSTITFLVANDISAELVFLYKDANGVRRIAENSWYFLFGSDDLLSPKIISPILTETHDGYAQVSRYDFRLEWTPSEGALYDITLYQFGEWVPEEGGSVNTGYSTWRAEDVEVPYCLIPDSYLLPNRLYSITVKATDPSTGNTTSASSDMFVIYEEREPVLHLTVPYNSQLHAATEEAPYLLANDGSLTLAWSTLRNTAQYSIRLDVCLNGTFYAIGKEYVTEQTTYTIPSEELYRSDNVEYYRLQLTATSCSGAVSTIQTYFKFIQTSPLELYLNGEQLTQQKTDISDYTVGVHELSWTELPDTDLYTLEIYTISDENWELKQTLEITDALSAASAWFTPGNYAIKVYGHSADTTVSAGCFYLNIVTEEDDEETETTTELRLLNPTTDWLKKGELVVEWTETPTGIYSLILADYRLSDSGTGYYYAGYYKQQDLRETSHTIPVDRLNFNTSYKLTITSGTESVSQIVKVLGPEAEMPQITGIQYSLSPLLSAVNHSCSEIMISWQNTDETAFFENMLYDDEGTLIFSERIATDPIIIPGHHLEMDESYQLVMRAFDEAGFSREYRVWFAMVPDTVSLSLNQSDLALYPCADYDQAQLEATITGTEYDLDDIIWTSTDETVAKVDNGVVYAVGKGTCTISASLPEREDVFAQCIVQVYTSDSCLVLPSSTTLIEQEALFGTAVECVIIPQGTKTIGSRSFAQCKALFIVRIPDTVESIAPDAFDDSPMLTILCSEGSAAHKYADAANINTVIID